MILPPTVNLDVWAQFPDGTILKVGRILSKNLRSRNRAGFFKYYPSYLAHHQAYPLDPEHLPLRTTSFKANDFTTGVHSIFADSLPDSWGTELLAQKSQIDLIDCAPAHLLMALGNSCIGRLLYTDFGQKKPPVPADESITFAEIKYALAEATKLEKSGGKLLGEELLYLWGSGSSAGGARPKVITTDEHNVKWIAKFSSLNDPSPVVNVALEQAGMVLAGKAGLQVPTLQRKTVEGREILLVQRFDISPAQGRYAIMSFKTLLGTNDPFAVSYGKLAEALQKHSCQPDIDLELLYRQMIVNLLLQNTDDHLQNFAMLHREKGWRLSPTYDIVPNIYQPSQLLSVNGKHLNIMREDVILDGRRFGFSASRSASIIDHVRHKLSKWQAVFQACGVPVTETTTLQENIRVAFARLAAS